MTAQGSEDFVLDLAILVEAHSEATLFGLWLNENYFILLLLCIVAINVM
jgi:hypothetical protein